MRVAQADVESWQTDLRFMYPDFLGEQVLHLKF